MQQSNNLPAGEAGVPTHIALIMDGNRRWAKAHHLPALAGHKYATDHTVEQLIEKAGDLNIKYITFWAWSTENWERDKKEVSGMIRLLSYAFSHKINRFHEKGAKLQIIGNTSQFPPPLQDSIRKGIEKTRNNTKITVIFALNYGGRDEILRAIKKMLESYNPQPTTHNLTNKDFAKYLDTAGIPDPDMIIRTGGEKRLSGFLLWQSEYAELYFTDTLFPDFTPEKLEEAIVWYQQRNRRFGK